ncbi:MAG TPA: hypothetical protein VK607_22055, partial [Kofleriaceae bacterium]|nr:hypothetical protein [Kofleriaceae bacterium]
MANGKARAGNGKAKPGNGKAVPGNGKSKGELRIRMYRVGFGDFFLISVPSPGGDQHILIDCGVTRGHTGKGDIASIKDAVRHMAEATDHRLALLIVTHRHQDHIVGFSRCEAEFRQFRGRVDAIWMPFWETEYAAHDKVRKFQADLHDTALALYQAALAGDADEINAEIAGLTMNATGAGEGPGGGSNARSLELLKRELGVTPKYYARGDQPELPAGLVNAGLSAQILGPPPAEQLDFLKLMDLKKTVGQYLDASGGVRTARGKLAPFAPEFIVGANAYPASAFREWTPRDGHGDPGASYHAVLEHSVKSATPDAMLTAAKQLDSILNNQSLVVRFTWRGKHLLFAGDAQGGNWQSWLYDLDKPKKDPSKDPLSDQGRDILGSLAFYKVGHHGSTNATPIAAVEAMGKAVVAMCSTQADTFGSSTSGTEVPREPLLDAIEHAERVVVRSDHYPVTVGGVRIPAVEGA